MAYRRNNTAGATATATHATRPARSAGQRSYIVSIDTGSFTNVEIIVGDYHNRAGVWTTSSGAVDTVKVTSNKSRHVYAYGMLLPSLSPPIYLFRRPAATDSFLLSCI